MFSEDGENMTYRYIGSKSRLVDQIMDHAGMPTAGGYFVDAFCGTGAVAEAAAELGWKIRINDHLHSAVISASARLISNAEACFSELGGYASAVQILNETKPLHGFIWQTYSPASSKYCSIERRYFTEENAAKIDAMRVKIAQWVKSGSISITEERLLIGDLFSALNRVANIAGTFGCFLSKWTPSAQRKISIRCRTLKNQSTEIETTVGDVFDVTPGPSDLVYLDPPYTKRQYASYYHILETVALGDQPVVEGVAGLRPWKNLASDFCYKRRALKTLTELIQNLHSQRILLSYSSEGHISMENLQSELSTFTQSKMHPLGVVGRYRPNQVASGKASMVTEYLVDISQRVVPSRDFDYQDKEAGHNI